MASDKETHPDAAEAADRVRRERDPGDAVPEGVAPRDPPPPTADDLRVKRALEERLRPTPPGKAQ